MLALSKALIVFFALHWAYWTYKTFRLGLRERERTKRSRGRWDPREHRRAAFIAYGFLCGTIASVVLARAVTNQPAENGGVVLAIHLPTAILLFAVLTVMTFSKAGIAARTHRLLTPFVLVLSPIVFVTGSILVARL